MDQSSVCAHSLHLPFNSLRCSPSHLQWFLAVFSLIITGFAAFASWLCIHRRWNGLSSKDPYPLPILGCDREVAANFYRLHDWLLSYFSDQHRTVTLHMFLRCVYLTVDPANVEYILKTNFQNYPKGKVHYSRLFDLMGNGIFNSDGSVWKKHRKIASAEFSNRKLRDFSTNAFREDAARLVEILDTAAKSQQSVDLYDLFLRMTLDSIVKVGFGVSMGSLSASLPSVPFGRAFDKANEIITARFVNLFWKLDRFLNLGKAKELRRQLETLNEFTSELIRKRKAEMANTDNETNTETREDLLSRFIRFEAGQAGAYGDQDLRDAMLNFLIAGRDTTAITLAWFVHCICSKPLVAETVFRETADVLGLQRTEEYSCREVANRLTYESLSKMHYLHAALTETLRLYPAVPRDGKTAQQNDILPDGTRIKRGNLVYYVPYSMGRMEFLWGKDALEYNPDRWLKEGVFQPESPFKFTAFQAGPRICLGKDSAYLQMKMTAALLLYFFRFRAVSGHVVRYRLLLVLAMANGLQVHVSAR